jgi:hypothetical protein
MPHILATSEVKIEWTDINSRVTHEKGSPHARTPGIHLSGVLRHIAISAGILKGVDPVTGKWDGDKDIDEEEMPMRMAIGMAWEDWAVGLYPDMLHQPGELERDNVFGTPDGITYDPFGDEPAIIEEFKATWLSSWKKDITQKWLWMHQGMGYCSMYGLARRVRYHVLWMNGDYRPPSPKYMTYLVEFSQAELDRGWALVLRNKDHENVKREG